MLLQSLTEIKMLFLILFGAVFYVAEAGYNTDYFEHLTARAYMDTGFGYSPVIETEWDAEQFIGDLKKHNYHYPIIHRAKPEALEGLKSAEENPEDVAVQGIYRIDFNTEKLRLIAK